MKARSVLLNLQQLKRAGLPSIAYARIAVLDPVALRRIAHFVLRSDRMVPQGPRELMYEMRKSGQYKGEGT